MTRMTPDEYLEAVRAEVIGQEVRYRPLPLNCESASVTHRLAKALCRCGKPAVESLE
jgi:hypothetical protein